jgi:hypothetical protein
LWYIRWTPCPGHERVNAWRRKDVQHSVEATSNEHIIGEKWQEEFLATVLPRVNSTILWQECVESLVRQCPANNFFALMASVKRMPAGSPRAGGEIRDSFFDWHQPLPFTLQNSFPHAKAADRRVKDGA